MTARRFQIVSRQTGTGKKSQLWLLANTGIPMELGFEAPVIVDIQGVQVDNNRLPIIYDHDESQRIGYTTEVHIIPFGVSEMVAGKVFHGPAIVAYGVAASKRQEAQEIVADLKAGIPFQVSIGAKATRMETVPEGETVLVNGQEWQGPLLVARQTELYELTITLFGADSKTRALAAKRKTETMKFDEWLNEKGFSDPTEEQKKVLLVAYQQEHPDKPKSVVKAKQEPQSKSERQKVREPQSKSSLQKVRELQAKDLRRRAKIEAVARKYGRDDLTITIDEEELSATEFAAYAIEQGWSVERFENRLLRATLDRPTTPAFHSRRSDMERFSPKALVCALLKEQMMPESGKNPHTGREYGLKALFDAKTMEEAEQPCYRLNGSLRALFDLQARAGGVTIPSTDMEACFEAAHEAYTKIRADRHLKASGFSTLNVVQILEDAMNKAAWQAFTATESVWRTFCGTSSVRDFKVHNRYQLAYDGSYRKVAADGELKHVSIVDTKKTIQADTFGAMISIDRKTRINDDLGQIVKTAQQLGQLGAQRLEELVFVTLLSNPGSFFSVANGNLISGGTTALSIDGLTQARETFRNQVVNGKPISVTPEILLVGTTLETTANRLWAEERLDATGNTDTVVFTNNPFRGLYRPVITPWLNNTAIRDQDGNAISGQSDTQWYLFANPNSPQGPAIEVAFLNGRETPYFDTAETQFNIPDGIQFRSYHDFGCAMQQEKMALKSVGA